MAYWSKWEVEFTDDKGVYHRVDFPTKPEVMRFCKAMKRMGAISIIASKGGDQMQPAFLHGFER